IGLGDEAAALKDEWARFKRREMSVDEFRLLYGRIDRFLEDMATGTRQLNNNLQDIILEQGYQDLTGQVLKRVIGLISGVEQELVNLVRIAGQVEEVSGLVRGIGDKEETRVVDNSKGEGPQIHADKREDVVSGQDDVDDLLS